MFLSWASCVVKLLYGLEMLYYGTKQHFLHLGLAPAGWFCGADLYYELRPSPAAGTAAKAGKEMSARLWYLSL